MSPSSAPFLIDMHAPAAEHAAHYVIGARNFLTDRVVPLPEIIVIPPRRTSVSNLRLSYDGNLRMLAAVGSWKRRLYERMRPAMRPDRSVPVLDLRPMEPGNWAHTLNIAFPLALMVRDRFRAEGLTDPVFVFPEKIPGKIIELFERFDLNCLCTSGSVEGALIVAEPVNPREQVFSHYRDWIAPHADQLRALIAEGAQGIPDKVFLDRRDGRCLANGDIVRDFLHERGFITCYPEDFSVAQQFALLGVPSQIVAIHGAGIAPLMFRQPEAGPLRFVEILSPGHMTIVFEQFTRTLPADYRMVRGRPTAKMCAAAFDLETTFEEYARNFSLASFEIDLTSLELALGAERIEHLLWAGGPLEYKDL